jgi:RNA polymerase sigma-70 factor (ECF subfamily)
MADPRAKMTILNNTQLLICKARDGSREAFDELVKRYEVPIELLVRLEAGTRVRGSVEVSDLVQETFTSAFESMPRFRGESRETFARWLSEIARNVVRGCARRMARRGTLLAGHVQPLQNDTAAVRAEPASSASTPSEYLREHERFERLQRALEKLSPEHREVIILARLRELPIRKVARLMGRSPEAAGMLLVRALRKLREHFGETDCLVLPRDMALDRGEQPAE